MRKKTLIRNLFTALTVIPILWGCEKKETSITTDTSRQEKALGNFTSSPFDDTLDPKNLGDYAVVFNDSNHYQLALAKKFGIKPINSLGDYYFTEAPLVRISNNENYRIEQLTHSIPYLVPEAADLLNDIGKAFKDSLIAQGAGEHHIIVTSVLRTPETVKSLRKVNVNAVDSSTHQYATTFDIAYQSFHAGQNARAVSEIKMKKLLAEILYNMRRQGRCLVKYEIKSPCFHITVNVPDDRKNR